MHAAEKVHTAALSTAEDRWLACSQSASGGTGMSSVTTSAAREASRTSACQPAAGTEGMWRWQQ